MNKFVLRQSLLLLLAATIWGVAFVAQSVGMDYVEPFTFNAVRSIIGGIVLLPCITFFQRFGKKTGTQSTKNEAQEVIARQQSDSTQKSEKKEEWKNLLISGISCGILLFVASNFQQFGIKYTTVGKAGFVTAMYIIIVPIIGIFLKKKAGVKIWGAVLLAVVGLYRLCMIGGGFSLQKGDILILLCAFIFSFHILIVDYFSPKVDGVKLSCIQFFTSGILSGICMLLFENPQVDLILEAWVPIVYSGALSCGVGYTLQVIGQRGINPTVASLLLSMESVISVIAGWFILNQKMSGRELSGCVLMLVAIILAQLPDFSPKKIVSDRK